MAVIYSSIPRVKDDARVGIFWVFRGKLLIDDTALSEAETYGDFLIQFSRSRRSVGAVPAKRHSSSRDGV